MDIVACVHQTGLDSTAKKCQEDLALLTDKSPLMELNGRRTATRATVPMGRLCAQ